MSDNIQYKAPHREHPSPGGHRWSTGDTVKFNRAFAAFWARRGVDVSQTKWDGHNFAFGETPRSRQSAAAAQHRKALGENIAQLEESAGFNPNAQATE